MGGWVVTRGAGQNSTYYGNIKDLVLEQEYATPRGSISSYGLPAHAVGPDLDELMMGSEGAFGVLTHVTLKVFRFMPRNRRGFARHLKRVVRRVGRRHDGLYLTGYPASSWEHGRFTDTYLREALQDYGIVIDTMECAVTWETMATVHKGVRRFAKSRPGTICMTHISHAYPQGANLYFIFIGKFSSKEEYREYQFGIFDSIRHYGASMSHHHGVGKMTAPWVEDSIGAEAMAVFRALKRHFDPDNLMNPGGTLGLDLKPEEKRRPRFAGRTWDSPAE